jgi:hypothetical protein
MLLHTIGTPHNKGSPSTVKHVLKLFLALFMAIDTINSITNFSFLTHTRTTCCNRRATLNGALGAVQPNAQEVVPIPMFAASTRLALVGQIFGQFAILLPYQLQLSLAKAPVWWMERPLLT